MKNIFTITACLCCMHIGLLAQPGALDSTFGNNGKFFAPDNSYPDFSIGDANDVVIQPDGKIVMVSSGIDYSNPDGTQDFVVTRLNPDGTLDNSFDGDGRAFINFSTNDVYSSDYGYQAALLPNGKIVVVGYAYDPYYIDSSNTQNYTDIAVARLNPDGSLDKNFEGDGKKLIDLSAFTGNINSTNYSYDVATSVIIRPSGKIIIAGYSTVDDGINPPNYDPVIIQLNSNGSFDNTFNGNGIQLLRRPGSDEALYGLALQPDNKVICSGFTVSQSTNLFDMMAIRLKINGAPDKSFGSDGFAFIDTGTPEEYGFSAAVQTDGRILLGGRHYLPDETAAFSLARLNSNGTLDNSFNGNGIQIYAQPDEDNYSSRGLAIQQDGKIIQCGGTSTSLNSNYNGGENVEVIRYNTDGSLDQGFGNHGRSVIDYGNWTDYLSDFGIDCAIQADGKIVVAGSSNDYFSGSYSGIAATRLLVKGKLITLDGPGDQTVTADSNACSIKVNNIAPIITPSDLHPKIYYHRYGATQDSGTGSLSGKQFNIGSTTVVYTLASNPLQRAVFTVTVTGGRTTAGGALDFDGIDDMVDLGNIYPIQSGNNGQYSFEAWIKVRAYTNDDGFGSWIFGDERNFNGGIQVQLDTLGYITTFHPNVGFVKSSYQVPLDTWTHIAFVQSYTQLDLYVNGNFVQTLLTSPNLHYDDYEDFTLGAFTSDFVNYTRHFNGEMDEVRVWNTAICPNQIQNNLHCEISDYTPGLVAYYKFDQGIAGCHNLTETYLNNDYGGYGTLKNFALSGPTSNWVKGHITGSCAPFTPLLLTCPDPITINLDSGQCSAIVNFSATAVSSCGSNVSITYSQDPGTNFYPGTTYVSVTATDDLGNQQYCYFPVTVTENEPPVLITKDTTVALTNGGVYFLSPYDVIASVTDNCGLANVSADVSYFDCNSLGSHTVTVYATDNSGNTTTGTATVTITPFVTTSFVTVSPAPVQYSDVATFTAGIIGAASFYCNGNYPATTATFRIGQMELGTAALGDDGYGNLIATLNRQMTKGFLDSLNSASLTPEERKVTAIFHGSSTDAIQFKQKAFTQLALGKEDAQFEYTGAQIINTNQTETAVPVSVRITDIDDGYRGDISNASVTFTIEPITPGVSIVGADSITTSTISLLNNDHTSGFAQAEFNISTGGKSTAKLQVTAKAGNNYKGKISVPVIVSSSATKALAREGIASSMSKVSEDNVFDVTAMPNPSQTWFNLKVQSANKLDRLNVRIMDITGRVIESKSNVGIGETIQLGEQYRAGTYLVEVRQGQNIKVLKLVKL